VPLYFILKMEAERVLRNFGTLPQHGVTTQKTSTWILHQLRKHQISHLILSQLFFQI